MLGRVPSYLLWEPCVLRVNQPLLSTLCYTKGNASASSCWESPALGTPSLEVWRAVLPHQARKGAPGLFWEALGPGGMALASPPPSSGGSPMHYFGKPRF